MLKKSSDFGQLWHTHVSDLLAASLKKQGQSVDYDFIALIRSDLLPAVRQSLPLLLALADRNAPIQLIAQMANNMVEGMAAIAWSQTTFRESFNPGIATAELAIRAGQIKAAAIETLARIAQSNSNPGRDVAVVQGLPKAALG